MGRAGAELADVAIVTSDNPRSEDPDAIIAQVLEGVAGRPPRFRHRRARPVPRSPWQSIGPGRVTLVVIAGKGHEQGQEFENGRKIPFDDRDVAREECGARRRSGDRARAEQIAAEAGGLLAPGAGDAGTTGGRAR